MARGQIPRWITAFLRGCGNGIKTDIGEEDCRDAFEYPGYPVRRKGMPVVGFNIKRADHDKGEDDQQLDADHDIVGRFGFLDPDINNNGDDDHDDKCRNIGDQMEIPDLRGQFPCLISFPCDDGSESRDCPERQSRKRLPYVP